MYVTVFGGRTRSLPTRVKMRLKSVLRINSGISPVHARKDAPTRLNCGRVRPCACGCSASTTDKSGFFPGLSMRLWVFSWIVPSVSAIHWFIHAPVCILFSTATGYGTDAVHPCARRGFLWFWRRLSGSSRFTHTPVGIPRVFFKAWRCPRKNPRFVHALEASGRYKPIRASAEILIENRKSMLAKEQPAYARTFWDGPKKAGGPSAHCGHFRKNSLRGEWAIGRIRPSRRLPRARHNPA